MMHSGNLQYEYFSAVTQRIPIRFLSEKSDNIELFPAKFAVKTSPCMEALSIRGRNVRPGPRDKNTPLYGG